MFLPIIRRQNDSASRSFHPCAVATEDTKLQLRQYAIRFKKSGTRIPRVALQEMGPRVGLAVRRYRLPPADMAKEALKQAKIGKKKVRWGAAREGWGRGYRQC